MANKKIKAFLIYRARDESCRVVKQRPRLDWDEISFTIEVNVPDPWGRLAGAIVIDLPEGGPPVVEVIQHEVPET